MADERYTPQIDVAIMMKLFGQAVRMLPQMIEDPKERLLAANLVVEEALEFADALGFNAEEQENGSIKLVPSGREPDLVKAIDGLGDILVVTYGGFNRLGVLAEPVFREVNRSNMSKVWPDGTIHKRESDGKVIKPDSYSPADIKGVIESLLPVSK